MFLGWREEQKVVIWIEGKCKSERWKHKESESCCLETMWLKFYHNFLLPLYWREANNMEADDSSTRAAWTDEERTTFPESVHQTDRNVLLDGNSSPTPPCISVESALSAAPYCCSRRMTSAWKKNCANNCISWQTYAEHLHGSSGWKRTQSQHSLLPNFKKIWS